MHISRNYSLLKQYVNIQSQSGVIGANGRRVLSHAGTKNRRGREDEPALSAIRPNAMERPRRARLAIYQRIVQVGTICKSGILSRLFLKKKVDGGWSTWKLSETCHRKCGTDLEIFKRDCSEPVPKFGGRSCEGSETRSIRCDTKPGCPVGRQNTEKKHNFGKKCYRKVAE